MNINDLFSALSLVSVFIYLTIGVYTYKQNPKSVIHKFFLLLCTSYSIWSLAYSFAYIAQDKYIFSFWNKISAIGWCSFSSLTLYLVLLITENSILKSRIVKILIFLPAFFFYFIAVFLFGEDIITSQIVSNIFYIGDFLYNFLFLLLSIFIILMWGLKTNNKRIKKQSIILVITSIIPFILNLLTQTILPIVVHIEFPKMGQLYSIIMILGIYIVITKYKFLKLPKNFIIEEVMNKMLDMVIIVDEKGEILVISNHALNILGYKEDELLKQKIELIMEDNIKSMFSLEKIRENDNKYYDMKLLKKDGQKIPVNISCKQIIDSKINEFLGAILVFQDISMIHELKRKNQEIFNEKQRFEITLLSVGDGVISTDKKGNVKFINKVGEQLTGWAQEEALDKPLEEVFNVINEFTREKCENPVLKVIETEEVIGINNQTILISKDGFEISIEDSAAPIRGEDGKISGIVLVFRDYTKKKEERKQIEYLSYNDQLTGLYNRRFYEEELKRIDTERNLPMTIVMADVNGLKLINDSFGHVFGDELLKKVAEVIKKGCRADDIIARLGGDEFIILLPKTDTYEAAQIVRRIKGLASKENVGPIDISISFGHETKCYCEERIGEVFRKAEDHMYKQKLFESPSMRGTTIQAIINTLYEKNKREEAHSHRVSKLCKDMGRALQLSEEEIQEFKTVGLLHDIGKIAIDENILNKSSKLTDDEWKEVKRHPEIGYRILSTVNDLADIAKYALYHHERWDGKGYPKGLKGEEIPFVSRIISIADAYDAMTSDRSYRCALSKEIAIKELLKNGGIQFDPELIRVFIEKVLSC